MSVNLAHTTVTSILIVWILILAFCASVGLVMKEVESLVAVSLSYLLGETLILQAHVYL